jgi:hypothetical protein
MDNSLRGMMIFATDESDGCVTEHWCVGRQWHVPVHLNLWDHDAGIKEIPLREIQRDQVKKCDGSCHTFDVRAAVQGIQLEELDDRGRILPSVLMISAEARALLEGDNPLRGQLFDEWYAKRNSRGKVICLGDKHVVISTAFSWWSGDSNVVNDTHKVEVRSCDGYCRIIPVDVTEGFADKLRELCCELRKS